MNNLQTTNILNQYHSQRGAALIVSMMMLIILTLIGVTSMRTTIMQERMTSNERNRSIAMQSSESGLRDAEAIVAALLFAEGYGQEPGELTETENDPDVFDPTAWENTDSVEATHNSHIAASGAPTRTMTKMLGRDRNGDGSLNQSGYDGNAVSPGVTHFRITSRGLGGDTRAEAILQTHIGARIR